MGKKSLELPIILNGKVYYPSSDRENLSIEYESGVEIIIPKPNKEDIKNMLNTDKYILHDVHYQDIICFLRKVGQFWDISNCQHELYQKAVNYLSKINGYDIKMAQREMNLINVMCSFGDVLHDMLDGELGNKFLLEEWIPVQDALVHVQPRGNILNIMVGNVPVSSTMSLVRSLITKNHTIAKLPKRDPITALFFALSFLEVDPNHPVSKAISIMYWEGGDAIEDPIIEKSDVVCVWGGESAVRGIQKKIKGDTELLAFGPKSSFAVIGKESIDSRKVAVDLAHDIAIYNQEACFSTQKVFVEGEVDALIDNLAYGLDLYADLLPKGFATIDTHSHVQKARLENKYIQNKVISSDDTNWTIVVINDPSEINEHPLSRCVYIIQIDHIKDCLKYIDKDTQTVTMSPWDRNVEIRDKATLYGASKITEIGLAEWQRIGMPHDNVYPLQRLVKWVGVERGLDYLGKHIEQGPVDTTLWLMMNNQLLENVNY